MSEDREITRMKEQIAARQKEILHENRQNQIASKKANERELYRLKDQQAARQKEIRQKEYEDNVRKREMARGSHVNYHVTDNDLLVAYHNAKVSFLPACNINGNQFLTFKIPCSPNGAHDIAAVKEFLGKSGQYIKERYTNDTQFDKAQELEIGGALYALVGGHAKATFVFKGYNPHSWVVKEFKWGLGGGLKFKVAGDFRPEVKKEIEPNATLYSKDGLGSNDGLEAKAETTHTKASASLTYKNNDNDKQPDSTVGTGLGVEGSAMFSVAVGRVGVAAGAQAGWRGGVYSTYSTNPNHIKGGYSEKNLKAVVAIGLEEKEER